MKNSKKIAAVVVAIAVGIYMCTRIDLEAILKSFDVLMCVSPVIVLYIHYKNKSLNDARAKVANKEILLTTHNFTKLLRERSLFIHFIMNLTVTIIFMSIDDIYNIYIPTLSFIATLHALALYSEYIYLTKALGLNECNEYEMESEV